MRGEAPGQFKLFSIFAVGTFVLVSAPGLSRAAPTLTVQGRILNSNNQPVESSSVQFRVRILSPSPQNCILYEELITRSLSDSKGLFSLPLNAGIGARQDSNAWSFSAVLSNSSSFDVSSSQCASGSGTVHYAPVAGDERQISILFKDATMASWDTMPTATLSHAAYAIESEAVGGFGSTALVRVEDPSTGPQSVSALTPTNFTDLLALVNGTSAKYARSSSAAGVVLPSTTSPASAVAGSLWFDSSDHTLKYNNGSSTQTLGTSGGSVTSVVTGTGLTGGPITTSGTISIANQGVDTAQLKDGAVTAAKLETVATAGTYGSATQVPVFALDTHGRVTSVTNTTLAGTLPSGTSGQFLKSNGTTWSGNSINLTDLKSSVSPYPSLIDLSTACGTSTTLTYSSANDRFSCASVGIDASQVTAGTISSSRLPSSATVWADQGSGKISYSGGNVGVGTTNPARSLSIVSSGSNVVADFTASSGSLVDVVSQSGTDGAAIRYQGPSGTWTTGVDPSITGSPYVIAAASNFLGLTAASSKLMTVTSGGSVGIGTTSPTAALHLKAGTSGSGGAPLKLTAGSNLSSPEAGAIEFDGTSMYYTTSGGTRQTLVTGGTSTFSGITTISNSGGDVTISPQSSSGSVVVSSGASSSTSTTGALKVSGGAGVTGDINAGASINAGTTISAATSVKTPQIYGSSSPSGTIKIDGTSDTTKGYLLLNSAGGSVGIGTATPTSGKLDVYGNAAFGISKQTADNYATMIVGGRPANDSTANIRLSPQTTANRGYDLNTYDNGSTFYFSIWGASVERVRLDSSGNLGIGTTAPSATLHVNKTAPAGTITSVGTAVTGSSTNFTSSLSVGDTIISNGYSATVASIASNTSLTLSGAFTADVSAKSYVRVGTVLNAGNVGIGTTSPMAKLQVAGQIVSTQNTVATGAAVDFANGNVQVLQSVGGTAITLSNMVDGGSYTLVVTDTTSRTYTFTNCTNSHFAPANGATTASTRTVYSILKTTESSAVHCYISWITGFQ